MKKKILITYVKVGGGHESIARGLKERLEEVFGNSIEIVISEPVNSWLDFAYQASTLVTPIFFNFIYTVFMSPSFIRIAYFANELVNGRKLRKYIRSINPDIVISTHFLIADEVKNMRKADGTEIPVVVYIADPLQPHPIWFNSHVDLFLSFDFENLPRKVREEKNEKIIPIGLPIRKAFFHIYEKKETFQEIRFDPEKFTIIFGGSGSGIDRLELIAKKFKDLESDAQAIFICGRNKVLERALTVLFRNNQNVRVFGYMSSEGIAALMQASDLFIGKVGPNIMFEAILSGVPIVATPPILGQEVVNREFISLKKLGFLTKNSSETIKYIREILKNPEIIKQQKKNMIALRERLVNREKKGFPEFIEWIQTTVMQKETSSFSHTHNKGGKFQQGPIEH